MEYDIWVRKLRALRNKKQLTQREVAERMHLSRSQYSAIENGLSLANYKHLYNLAKVFRMTMADLVTMRDVRSA